MKLKTIFITLITLTLTFNVYSQNHYFGLITGYTKSMPTEPENQVNYSGNEISVSQGVKNFKGLDGFQIGIYSHIDTGNDFLHLDICPQYSRYGFKDSQNITYDYLDLDIGASSFNAESKRKFVLGLGITPSFILRSEEIEDINVFDIKAYLTIGYRIYKNYVLSTKLRYGVIEIIPESEITNLQISLNLNIPILKIKK